MGGLRAWGSRGVVRAGRRAERHSVRRGLPGPRHHHSPGVRNGPARAPAAMAGRAVVGHRGHGMVGTAAAAHAGHRPVRPGCGPPGAGGRGLRSRRAGRQPAQLPSHLPVDGAVLRGHAGPAGAGRARRAVAGQPAPPGPGAGSRRRAPTRRVPAARGSGPHRGTVPHRRRDARRPGPPPEPHRPAHRCAGHEERHTARTDRRTPRPAAHDIRRSPHRSARCSRCTARLRRIADQRRPHAGDEGSGGTGRRCPRRRPAHRADHRRPSRAGSHHSPPGRVPHRPGGTDQCPQARRRRSGDRTHRLRATRHSRRGHQPPGTPRTDTVGSGYGLVGLRERVAALGGHLDSGPAGAGAWRLAARIPHPAGIEQNGTRT